MRPNKKMRHQIYLVAIQLFREEALTGMCYALHKATRKLNLDIDVYGEMEENFPEIYRHKPHLLTPGGFWFPEWNKVSRYAIFEMAIAESTRKTRKTC